MPRAPISLRTAAQRRSSSLPEMRVATRSMSVIFLILALDCSSTLLVHDPAAQRADAGDLHLQHIAGLHPDGRRAAVADAIGRSGGDHVAWRKRGEVGAEGDDLRDRVDQEIGTRALHFRA